MTSIWTKIKQWFIPKQHKCHRCVYAVTAGCYMGEMLIFIKQFGYGMHFLSVPDNKNRVIPQEKFDFGIENHILELVKKLPKNVHAISVKQYEKNESVAASSGN